MQTKEIAIQIRDLDKVFHLRQTGDKTKGNHQDFYALRNISLDIYRGEFVGVVGSNGSGKSTLLKILSGILKPTSGSVKLYGNVSSVLELGVNLHPDLSAKENALLQLRISGVRKQDADSVLEQIKALSDIGDYFYEPVKFFSNGMFLRLAFAVSFHVKTDILLLDEVLSVGDEEFRLKCLSYLKRLVAGNKTILLVTHNPVEAVSLCSSGVWLREGKVEKLGAAPEVVESYLLWQRMKYVTSEEESGIGEKIPEKKMDGFFREWTDHAAPGNEILHLRHICVSHQKRYDVLYTDEEITVEVCFKKHSADISISMLLSVTDQFGQQAFLCHNLNNANQQDHQGIFKNDTGLFNLKCFVPKNFLAAGRYKLTFLFGKNPMIEKPQTEEAFRYDDNVYFYLQYRHENADYIGQKMNGSVRPAFKWEYVKV